MNSWSGFRNWAFRGQADAEWKLQSSLSRHIAISSVCQAAWPRQESRIARIFKRKAHLFVRDQPQDELEWLALMQHHGAPTRLLDLTWSPYVAAFFALENARTDATVWAFNLPLIWNDAKRLPGNAGIWEADPRQEGNFEKYFLQNEFAFVWQGDPFRMPQRVIAQSGTFLVCGHVGHTVEEILEQYPRKRRSRASHDDPLLMQFVFPTSVRDEAMASLYSMNITQATLFPGMDGLARSMAYEFEFSWEVDLKTNKPRDSMRGHIPSELLEKAKPD